jgi:hypothetical protein
MGSEIQVDDEQKMEVAFGRSPGTSVTGKENGDYITTSTKILLQGNQKIPFGTNDTTLLLYS